GRARLDGPGRERLALSVRKLSRLAIRGWAPDQEFQDGALQLEQPGGVERRDELGMREVAREIRGVAIGVATITCIARQQRMFGHRFWRDVAHSMTDVRAPRAFRGVAHTSCRDARAAADRAPRASAHRATRARRAVSGSLRIAHRAVA